MSLSRLRSAATLFLHLSVVAAAPLAEARLEGGAAEAAVHIESESSANCPVSHNHLLCQICRQLESRFTPGSSPQRDHQCHVVRASAPRSPRVDEPDSFFGLSLGPRAPPHA